MTDGWLFFQENEKQEKIKLKIKKHNFVLLQYDEVIVIKIEVFNDEIKNQFLKNITLISLHV